jgi:hypothetical protein
MRTGPRRVAADLGRCASVLLLIATTFCVELARPVFAQEPTGSLGTIVGDVSKEMASEAALPGPTGALVTVVLPGEAGERAGLRAGDIVLAANRNAIADAMGLIRFMESTRPGDAVQLTVHRQRAPVDVRAVLGSSQSAAARLDPSFRREAVLRSCTVGTCPWCLSEMGSLGRPKNADCDACLKDANVPAYIAACVDAANVAATAPPSPTAVAPQSTMPPADPPATRLTLHEVVVEPERVTAGGAFAVKVSYSSPSNATVSFSFAITAGGRELLSSKVENIPGTGGARMLYTRSLAASSEPGTYVVRVRLALDGRAVEETASVTVAAK